MKKKERKIFLYGRATEVLNYWPPGRRNPSEPGGPSHKAAHIILFTGPTGCWMVYVIWIAEHENRRREIRFYSIRMDHT